MYTEDFREVFDLLWFSHWKPTSYISVQVYMYMLVYFLPVLCMNYGSL